jgi:Rhodopirellula transposase DDE domain
MMHTTSIPALRTKFEALWPVMDERLQRQWAAAEALALGYGGISAVAAATGLARNTIAAGIAELRQRTDDYEPTPTIRRPGAGRKPLTTLDSELLHALDRLIDPATRGDPDSPLRWTCKSTAKLAEELTRQSHPISDRSVAHLLREAGYSLQANRKTREGGSHPDRNAQFEHLNNQVRRRQQRGQPVISVDTKKKELVGDFRNGGREWQPSGQPEDVRVHDFQDKELGKAIPYGVYDVTHDQGWVSVGITHDTAYFATATIQRWWQKMGAARFPAATGILITADGGGSNGVRTRLWKVALQELANEVGMPLSVCHFPPGTSKWNKIEHRLFCYITQNWRGRPLVSREAIVSLIGATTTESGLRVEAELDISDYPTGIKVTDEELAAVNLKRAKFHGEWNYTISPRN